MPIPYYDSADNRLMDKLSDAKVERFLALGIAYAVRKRNGQIVQLRSLAKERAYGSLAAAVAAMNAAVTKTTIMVRTGGGVLTREHKRADGWGWNEAARERCEQLCNENSRDVCTCDEITAAFNAGDPAVEEAVTGRSGERWLDAAARQSLRTFAGSCTFAKPELHAAVCKGRMSDADAVRRNTASEGLRRRAGLTPEEWYKSSQTD
jgi:hypothetical protein